MAPAPHHAPLNLLTNLQQGKAIVCNMIFGESFDHNTEDPEASLLNRWVIRGDYKLLLTYDGVAGSGYGRRVLPKDPRPQLSNLITDPPKKSTSPAKNPNWSRNSAG